ncbi:MAG: OprO/OprP family phosphate-selective porin [Clostridia bacterium]|nr:OprO/OprP family phosphate-selective porin [Clostridia bacterium]
MARREDFQDDEYYTYPVYEQEDDMYSDDDYLVYDEEDDWDIPPEEKRLRRIGRFKVAAGLFNFTSLIVGLLVSFAMLALILSLVNWVVADMNQTLSFFGSR